MISTSEFIKFLDDSVKSGLITQEEKDDYVFDCAYAQRNNENIQNLMKRIIEEVESNR
jgi:polyhydroxyalkanoate synthesis regulator phasin